jgi:NDP-sugar pyrophosphorylase family protein
MKAMILAAGIGSRLMPLTKEKPKALVEVGGKTMLERIIQHLKQFGFSDIIINLHHFPDKIKTFLAKNDYFGTSIQFSEEYDELLDTGGAIKKASWFFDKQPFLVYNTDILTNLNLSVLWDYHLQHQGIATLVVRKRESARYLLFNADNMLAGWENVKKGEKKLVADGSFDKRLAFSGIHVINPEIFHHLPNQHTFSVIEAYLDIARKKNIYGFQDEESYWFDIGDLEKLEKAHNFILQKK